MKRGQIINISRQLPRDGPFRTYRDLQDHWNHLVHNILTDTQRIHAVHTHTHTHTTTQSRCHGNLFFELHLLSLRPSACFYSKFVCVCVCVLQYGYRLPDLAEEEVVYCSVYFRLVGERLFTYPSKLNIMTTLLLLLF